jgi:hypothetical protein
MGILVLRLIFREPKLFIFKLLWRCDVLKLDNIVRRVHAATSLAS